MLTAHGVVFKAHRLLYHSTLGLKVIAKGGEGVVRCWLDTEVRYVQALLKPTTNNLQIAFLGTEMCGVCSSIA